MNVQHEAYQDIILKDDGDIFRQMFSGTTFRQVCAIIEKTSTLAHVYGYEDRILGEDEEQSGVLKFRGDLFEIFAEVFFLLNATNNRVGIYDYTPVYSDDDNGVDAYGKNIHGQNATVQVKFRADPTYELKERDIKQFGFQSLSKYDVDLTQNHNLIIFTNCKGVHWYTATSVFSGALTVFDGAFISRQTDENHGFWESARKLIEPEF